MTPLRFTLPTGHLLTVASAALAKMVRHRQTDDVAAEAGGVLLGRVFSSGNLIIDDVTEPIETDRRSRSTFHRSVEHQALVDAAHNESDGFCGYSGEWHTHPQCDPVPSPIDIEDWLLRVRRDTFDGDGLIAIIVGQEVTRAWFIDRAGNVRALSTNGSATVAPPPPPTGRGT